MKTIQHQPRRGGSGMLVSTRGAILGRYFKTEKQVLKHLNDTDARFKKAGIVMVPEYYDNVAVLEFKGGYLLTTKTAVEKHAKQYKRISGAGTDSTAKTAVHDNAINPVHGSPAKRSKADGGNYKKPSKKNI